MACAVCLAGCQNDTQGNETPEYGTVGTEATVDYDTSAFVGYYIFNQIINSEANDYADSKETYKDAFEIEQSEGINLVLTIRPEPDSLESKELLLACIDRYRNTYILSNGTTFEFSPDSEECTVQIPGNEEKWLYKKGIARTAARGDVINDKISAGQGQLEIAEELVPGILRRAKEEGTDCVYRDNDGNEILMLPVPSEDRQFRGTHILIWNDKDYGYGDIAIVYFDGEYGERQADVLGYRRTYGMFVDIQPDAIDGYKKTGEEITLSMANSVLEAYREATEEETEDTTEEETESIPAEEEGTDAE